MRLIVTSELNATLRHLIKNNKPGMRWLDYCDLIWLHVGLKKLIVLTNTTTNNNTDYYYLWAAFRIGSPEFVWD